MISDSNITNFHLAHVIYFNYHFSHIGCKAFHIYIIGKSIDMLPKRSTSVEQTLEHESIHSQFSVAIFIASGTHVVAQKSSKQFQTPLNIESYHRRNMQIFDVSAYK